MGQWLGWSTAVLIWINLILQIVAHHFQRKRQNILHEENLDLYRRVNVLEMMLGRILNNLNTHMDTLRQQEEERQHH